MAGSATSAIDDMLAAYTKPPPDAAGAQRSPIDSALDAYLKPPPPTTTAAPEADVVRDPETGVLLTPSYAGIPSAGAVLDAANDAARASNAAIGRTVAPLQPGTTELGPNATAADIPPDSRAAQIRSGAQFTQPLEEIDSKATFEALSERRNKLLATGQDPKTDPEYRNLLQLQAKGIAQNNQAGALFLVPGSGAVGGGVAGVLSRVGNRLVDTAPAAANRLAAAPAEVAAGPAVVAPVEPTWNRLAQSPDAPQVPVADAVAALKEKAAPAQAAVPAGPPVPRDLGAAASSATDTNMSPQQIAIYRASAEGRKLLEPQQIGVADTTAYVPGVSASTAEIEQTVNHAREAKAANVVHPEVSQAAKETAAANSDARAQHFASVAGDEVSTGLLKDAQKEQLDGDYPAAFAKAGVPDTTPITKAIEDSLSTPRGKQNEQLQAHIKPLLDRLRNADGTPKILDAEELYGFRESLNRMRSRASQSEKPGLEHVAGEIGDLIAATDKQIEAAAPGYRKYMDNYAAAQRAIDEQEILQKHEPKLFDSQNRMTYNKFQTFMRQVVDARGARGLNPYKSISDETMQKLWNIRDDLRRSASAQELARTPGSDTTQTAMDVVKHMGAGAARLGAHAAANAVAPVLGSIAVNTAESMLNVRRGAKAKRVGVAKGLQNLNPNRLVKPED